MSAREQVTETAEQAPGSYLLHIGRVARLSRF